MAEEIYQGQDSAQQDKPEKILNLFANREMLTTVLIVAFAVLSGIYLIWDNFLGAQPDVKINGTPVSMNATVQDLLDAGFVLCDFKGYIKYDADETVMGRYIDSSYYYIGVPRSGLHGYNSGVQITLVNFNSDTRKLKDCNIFEMVYYPGYQEDGVEVLIGGENLKDASLDEWADFFKKALYPFKKADVDEFRRGDTTYLYEKKGKYKFRANSDYDYIDDGTMEYHFESLSYTRDIDVKYEPGFPRAR